MLYGSWPTIEEIHARSKGLTIGNNLAGGAGCTEAIVDVADHNAGGATAKGGMKGGVTVGGDTVAAAAGDSDDQAGYQTCQDAE